MKKIVKKIISLTLALALLFPILPVSSLAAAHSPSTTYTLANDNIKVTVSGDNGGFVVRTIDGDILKKDDNNKNLLYHNGLYDTSFTSFRVDYGSGKVKDYLFGGDYGFLGLNSSEVTVTQDDMGITAVWTVDKITFTQRLELSTGGSQEHGMVSVKYSAKNSGSSDVSIKARVLLDTALVIRIMVIIS